MKRYLCVEDGEAFVIEASDFADAKESAATYNAEVIREMSELEVLKEKEPYSEGINYGEGYMIGGLNEF